ncbi:ABC transporter substrate-binding protein [Microbacterium sp. MAHUQ-60]|uniref:ABC transporter substrate-binding protein n=1 Tax=unclassified Microbacterium TaxID=2609290 RepID=UPI003617162F
MTPTRTLTAPVLAVSALALILSGCSASGGGGASNREPVEGATFTQVLNADPGNLDPQMSAASALFDLSLFAYDSLVSVNDDGETESQLASEWDMDGLTASLTIKDGILCSDGTEFTAQTAADNLNWVSDPANQSPFLGAFLPAGVTTVADGDTITLTLSAPAPFLFLGLSSLPMVCEAGLKDRSTLAAASNGTGPYELAEAVPNDHYTFTLREEYAWGPDGATVDVPGIPAKVTLRIVADGTTATNLLLSGEVNAAQITGPDADRALAADLFSLEATAVTGEQWYNHAEGHPTSDPAVRMALTQAVDLDELSKVITAGKGGPGTALATVDPRGCTFESVPGSLPAFDVDAAEAALEEAGWIAGADGVRVKDGERLSIVFLYNNSVGAQGTAAAELAMDAWQKIGVEVDGRQQDEPVLLDALFGTGAWDVSWVTLSVNSPDQIVGFMSGPVTPEGSNFSAIQNADYEAGVAEAVQLPGTEGCPSWQAAETALFEAADLVPFANSTIHMFGNGAEFEWLGQIAPTSIRMLG